MNKTSLGTSLQKQVGSASERFSLSFMDEENKRVSLTNPMLTLTISLNTSKEFEGIYVLKDNALQELTYKKIDKNTIEVTTDSYNDLVLKYKSNDVEQPSVDQNVGQDNLPDIGNVNINWLLIAGIIIAFIALIVLINKRK